MNKVIFLQCALAITLFQFVQTDVVAKELGLSKEAIIKRMQQGGLVLYFRHASTETDYADQVKADVNNGSTQRVLSEKGWHEAVNTFVLGRPHGWHLANMRKELI